MHSTSRPTSIAAKKKKLALAKATVKLLTPSQVKAAGGAKSCNDSLHFSCGSDPL